MDWHLESSALLILSTVIFIKAIHSIQTLHIQPINFPFSSCSGLHKQWRMGHKKYIIGLWETISVFVESVKQMLQMKNWKSFLDNKKKKKWNNMVINKNTSPQNWLTTQPKTKGLMNNLVTELIAVNYELCSHCGSTKEDIPTQQSDVITKVRCTPLCVIYSWQPTLTDDLPGWRLPQSSCWARDTPSRNPTPALSKLLPCNCILKIFTPAQTPTWPGNKVIYNSNHRAAIASRSHHSQSRVYHSMLLCRAKKYDSPSAGCRRGWALE